MSFASPPASSSRPLATLITFLLVFGCRGDVELVGDGDPSDTDAPAPMSPEETDPCTTPQDSFVGEVYAPIFSRCIGCHNDFGLARRYDLRHRLVFPGEPDFAETNVDVLRPLAEESAETLAGGTLPLLLAKATGVAADGHVGGEVFAPDSRESRLLSSFVDKLREPPSCDEPAANPAAALVDGLELATPRETYARAHSFMTGRPAPPDALEGVDDEASLRAALDGLLHDVSGSRPTAERLERLDLLFADWLMVASNGAPGSDSAFQPQSGWPGHDYFQPFCTTRRYPGCCSEEEDDCCLEHFEEAWCERGRSDVRLDLAHESLELARHLVHEDRPIAELVTADYAMVTPFTAHFYGLEDDQIDALFDDDPSNDDREVVSATIPVTERNRLEPAPNGASVYPHAGILSMHSLLGRHPSTRVNLNRTRAARLVLDQLLAVPILSFADFSTNTLPPGADLELATQEYDACTACHAAMDPIAGFFRNYPWYGRYRPDHGWARLPDHFPAPTFLGESVPDGQNDLAWLGGRLAEHPRFPLAILAALVEGTTGIDLFPMPRDGADPEYRAKVLAFQIHQLLLERLRARFPDNSADVPLRQLLVEVFASPFFRARSVPSMDEEAEAAVGLAGLGGGVLVTPEQLSVQLTERLGVAPMDAPGAGYKSDDGDNTLRSFRWYRTLMGGTNWDSVPDRYREPNHVAVRLAERVANDHACRAVPADFSHPDSDVRLLFRHVEPTTTLDGDGEAMRRQMQWLFLWLLDRDLALDDAEIDDSLALWREVHERGQIVLADTPEWRRGRMECGFTPEDGVTDRVAVDDDPEYVLRTWIAVLSHFLTDPRFLLE
ncbi:MAG TPA: hypothetical protein RMH99_01095 [Sandaracinaceae bacterium LLY-WYZ-13_1]|nr:hypothetical protein [Sandaracinaceae bacterium LLY-WYZ-13_1]